MAKAARDLAFELFDQGKRPSDPEVKALGIKSKTRYNYFQQWKNPKIATPTNEKGSEAGAKVVTRTGSAPIEVGKITITPENWGMTQHGAIIVLDTYNKAKRDINYGGTIGDFLCDVCVFYRRILNYEEVKDDGDTSKGRGGAEEDGGAGSGQILAITR